MTIDQNTPLTAERLAEIRDLNVDSCSADAPYNPDVWALEKARKDLLAAFDSLTETAHHQARMIAEITDACMAAESDALRHRTQVAELSALLRDPDRLADHLHKLRADLAEQERDAEIDRLADGGEL
ncbi:MAG TPA: hypothetical protein VIP77_15610 [Jiangellaceae bacterium]